MAFARARRLGFAPAFFISTLFLTGAQRDVRRRRWLLRYGVPALLVVLCPALLWAAFGTSFKGVATVLSTGSITLAGPEGLAVDSLGNLYIADTSGNQVVEVTAAGVASVLAFPGLSPALHSPEAVAFDGLGNLYIADTNNARVVELAQGIASVVNTGGLLTNPAGVAFDAAGDLYIADATNNDIVEVPAGGVAAVLAISGLGTPLNGPQGLAVDVSGNLYIADGANSRIVKVTPGGAGSVLSITGGVTLATALAVAVDGLGNVYIADTLHNRIVTVTPAGVGGVVNTQSNTTVNTRGVAVGVSGAVYIADAGGVRIVEVQPSSVGFGHVQMGAGSGTTLTLPFTIGFGVTLGSVQALTLGTPNLDFTVGTGTTCVSGITGAACTVDITFLTTAPGLRRGAVVLYNNATRPLPILTVPLYGTGDAPLAALSPGTASLAGIVGATLSAPFQLAFDGAGNMYVADYGAATGNVVKVPVGGGTAAVVSIAEFTLAGAIGVVLDGAGNLYISDHFHSRIVEVTAGGAISALNITGVSPVLGITGAIAMDGAGNLYISDYGRGRIVKVTPSGAGSVLGTGSFTFGTNSVLGVAVDAAGTVYIPDSAGNRVVKVTAAGAASLVVPAGITPALSSPQGVAVDAFGNLYIADAGNKRIVEITTAGVASVVQMPGQSLLTDYGVTVDASGNVFIPDFSANHIVKVNVAGAALAAFPNTNVGSASTPKTATVTNLGDLPLVFALNPTYTADFPQYGGDTNPCTMTTTLAAGTVCDVPVQFMPQSAASLSASIVVTNDNLNVSNSTQSVAVSGTGLSAGDTTAVTVSTNPATTVNIGQPVTITVTVGDTTAGHTSTVPTGAVTFTDMVGTTAVSLNSGAPVTLSGGTASLPGVTLSGVGLHTITANYAGVSGSFLGSSNTTALTVSATTTGPASVTVALVSSANPVLLKNAVTFTATVSSAAGTPDGSVGFNDGTTLLGSGTLAQGVATFTTSSLAVGAHSITAAYSGSSNFTALTSAALAETVSDFTLNISPSGSTSATAAPGGTATYALVIGPSSGSIFPAVVTLSLSGLPPGATGTVTPQTLAAGAGASNVTVTVQLPIKTASLHASHRHGDLLALGLSPGLLGMTLGMLLLPFGERIRRTARKRGRSLSLLLLAVAATSLLGLTGCGATNSGFFGQQQQSYTLTLTATSGTLSHSTTLSLTVK